MKSIIRLSACFILLSAFASCKNSGNISTNSKAVVYVCPMHPEVTSENPGKCPKCGMALERKK